MQIRNVMTRNPQLINPDDTIQHAARLMAECDCGILPVSEGDHLVGMISDRDIAIRGIGNGKGPHSKVRDAMTREVKYCFEDEDAAHVAKNMADLQVRRLPVMNREAFRLGLKTAIIRNGQSVSEQYVCHPRHPVAVHRSRFAESGPIWKPWKRPCAGPP